MAITQKRLDPMNASSLPVILASRPAGVVTNTAPTKIMRTSEKTSMTIRAVLPSSLPIISGRLAPRWRIDTMAERKSCTAPPKIHPSTIQMNAAGPNKMPCMAPKIGPVPAMLRNWMRNTFHVGIGMKSTPSRLVKHGV